MGAVDDEPGAQEGLGVRSLVDRRSGRLGRSREQRAALDQDQLAGDRDERADVADPVDLEARERVEVRLGERPERNREDVEVARLDERQEEPERSLERLEPDLGRGLGPATLAEDHGRGESGQLHHAQLASSARRRSSPAAGSTGSAWCRISSAVRTEQPASRASRADSSAWSRSRSRIPVQPGTCRARRHDPRPPRLAERPGDPREDAGLALATVVEEPGEEELVVGRPGRAERRHDVEAVAPVGDVHPVEQGELGRRQPRPEGVTLGRFHPGPEVAPELADLRRPGEGW